MARYTGPVCRLCRRLGEKLYLKGEKCFTPKCAFEKRPYAPGQRSTRRRKVSDRGLQLREKQRGRVDLRHPGAAVPRYYEEAVRRHGVTGENLLRTLELRLDNVGLPARLRRLAPAGPADRPPRPHRRQRPQVGHPIPCPEGRTMSSA